MDTTFKNAFEFKVIYVFTIDDQAQRTNAIKLTVR